MYSLVDLNTATVIPQKGQTALTFPEIKRITLPDGAVIFNPSPGYEYPPLYGEPDEPPVQIKLYEVVIAEVGSGSVIVSDSDPVFDAQADTVTVTRTLKAAPAPPDPADVVEDMMTNDPFKRAWVKRQARKEGKTPRQIMDEIRAGAS